MDLSELRPLKVDEFQQLLDFYDRVTANLAGRRFHPGWEKGVWPTEPFLKDLVDGSRLFVAEIDGKLAAAIGIDHVTAPGYEKVPWAKDLPPEKVSVWHVLAVAGEFEGQGVAKRLVAKALELARQEKQEAIRLDVFPINLPAARLYESCGFSFRGRHWLSYPDIEAIHSMIYEYLL